MNCESSRRIKSPRFEYLGGETSKNWKSVEANEQFGVPTSGFTAYAVPGAAERTMINSGAGNRAG